MTLWWAWVGRDPRPGSIVPGWRPPDGVPPGAAGALVDQRAGPADVLATLLDLASRGYLTIREVHPSGVPAEGDEAARVARSILQSVGLWTTEWEFRRTDRPLDDLAPFEGAIVHGLLGGEPSVTMSAVAPSFREILPGLYQGLYRDMVERGWFRHSPQATRREWVILGGVIAAVGAAAIVWLGRVDLGLGLILSGRVVLAFAPAMPVVTRKGAHARDRLLGFREYVRRAERAEVEARHRRRARSRSLRRDPSLRDRARCRGPLAEGVRRPYRWSRMVPRRGRRRAHVVLGVDGSLLERGDRRVRDRSERAGRLSAPSLRG